MKSLFILCFLICPFCFHAEAQKNAADTAKAKWNGKWDPTDPLCPCYEIQKQAEKEYQDMLKKSDTLSLSGKKDTLQNQSEKSQVMMRNERTGNTKIVVLKHTRKKRNKNRERKYKKGKAVCPEVKYKIYPGRPSRAYAV